MLASSSVEPIGLRKTTLRDYPSLPETESKIIHPSPMVRQIPSPNEEKKRPSNLAR
jgi:hypothetical protein